LEALHPNAPLAAGLYKSSTEQTVSCQSTPLSPTAKRCRTFANDAGLLKYWLNLPWWSVAKWVSICQTVLHRETTWTNLQRHTRWFRFGVWFSPGNAGRSWCDGLFCLPSNEVPKLVN